MSPDADANDDGLINLSDPVKYRFRGGDPLLDPLDEPGIDPTLDSMTCRTR